MKVCATNISDLFFVFFSVPSVINQPLSTQLVPKGPLRQLRSCSQHVGASVMSSKSQMDLAKPLCTSITSILLTHCTLYVYHEN